VNFSSRTAVAILNAEAKLDRVMLEELQREDQSVASLTPWTFHDIRRGVRTKMSELPIPEGDRVWS
jgi:hypothetical protein